MTGTWGGPHAELTVSASSSRLELDCAAGTIDQALPASGSATLPGTYTPGTGGPVDPTRLPMPIAATYRVTVSGDRMTLTIEFPNTSRANVGPFSLVRNQRGELTRCL
jgi:hypothetical protein